VKKALDYVSDHQLESASKDAPSKVTPQKSVWRFRGPSLRTVILTLCQRMTDERTGI